jgi:hypothetical protein
MVEVDPSYAEFKQIGSSAIRRRPTDALIRVSGDRVDAEMFKLERPTPDGRHYAPEKVIAMALTMLRR